MTPRIATKITILWCVLTVVFTWLIGFALGGGIFFEVWVAGIVTTLIVCFILTGVDRELEELAALSPFISILWPVCFIGILCFIAVFVLHMIGRTLAHD